MTFARAALLAAIIAVPSTGVAQRSSVIPTGQTASPTLTPGIKVGDVVYASGQLGVQADAPDSTIVGQTRRALEKLKVVLEAGGSNMANVAKCTVFLVDVKDFAGMNGVYREFFPKEPPARSTVVVAELVSAPARVEIECIGAVVK